MNYNNCIIAGGAGYVGSHLINYLVEGNIYNNIIIIDYIKPVIDYSKFSSDIYIIYTDIRKNINPEPFKKLGCNNKTVIYNLAAICRIPGYPNIDYFRTNIRGAETICKLADDLGCKKIVFTSSVSPYGKSEDLKTEGSIPTPDDPYGSSKLVAEYIHRGWQEKDPKNRLLSILRPGIIFGKGEQANFTRLYESQKKGFFVYPGRKDTKKACVYVKDVAKACYSFSQMQPGQHIYNLVYENAPTIEKICKTVAKHTDAKKPLFKVPGSLLMFAAYCIMVLGKMIGKDFNGIHPDRVKKVMLSTNISGKKLKDSGFLLDYSLDDAIKDWYKDCNFEQLG